MLRAASQVIKEWNELIGWLMRLVRKSYSLRESIKMIRARIIKVSGYFVIVRAASRD